MTGLAYAELVTKYPQAAGAALYVNKAFGNRLLTFLIAVSMLVGLLRRSRVAGDRLRGVLRRDLGPAAGAAGVAGVHRRAVLVNFVGITQSAVDNMAMTFVEVAGLLLII